MINGYNMGFRTGSTAYIKFNEEGEVTLFTGTTDNGQGNDSMMVQIAAEELGLKMAEINLASADTDLAPLDPGSYSMSSTFVSANAVRMAALDAKRQIADLAGETLEANPIDIDLKDKVAFVKGIRQRAFRLETSSEGLIKEETQFSVPAISTQIWISKEVGLRVASRKGS
jgi:4-hydroxybenzoyl-CoA reductase subunit alpha